MIADPYAVTTSQSVEDFLKALLALQKVHERVSTNALAEALSVAAPSVTDMAARLGTSGLIDYRKYHGMRLTEGGEQVAQEIIRRHELIEAYLVCHLGFAPDEAHQEAEQMEHAVSNRFVNALIHRLKNRALDFCNESKMGEAVLLLHKPGK